MTDALLTPRMKVSLALTTALSIVRDIEERNPVQSARMDAADLRRIIVELFDDTKAILDYVDVQEKNLRELCEEGNQREREITTLRGKVNDAVHTAEAMGRELASALDHVTAAFNDVRQLPARLTGEHVRPMGVRLDPVQPATQKGA